MPRKSAPGTLIHCEYCGEDYSATYRRCPFCGEKQPAQAPDERGRSFRGERDPEDDYAFQGQDLFDDMQDEESEPIVDRSRGGKRLSLDNTPRQTNWTRVVTFICSLVIIAAALVIVFSYLYPRIHTADKNPASNPSDSLLPSQSQPAEPDDTAPPASEPPVETGELPAISDQPVQVPSEVVLGIKLNKTGFTLQADESFTIEAVIDPASWSGDVSWTTTEPKLMKLEPRGVVQKADGTEVHQCVVTNTNSGKSILSGTITVSAGDQSVDTTVYVRPGSTPDISGGNTVAAGTEGVITGASSGLRVRSGPGTNYDKVASLRNGARVTVLEDAGDGWYKINYGDGTGYIMGQYINMG